MQKISKRSYALPILLCIILAVIFGCQKNQEPKDIVVQQVIKQQSNYSVLLKDLEDGYKERLYSRTRIDSLRFIKTVFLGQDFFSDSLHIDSLICYSEAYQAQKDWRNLQDIDYSQRRIRVSVESLVEKLKKIMQPNGCMIGGLEPTAEQLQQVLDSCSVYQLKADYFSAIERSDSFYVGFDIYRIKNVEDSFPGLLAWIGTNPEAMDSLRLKSAFNQAKYQLRKAYANAEINYLDKDCIHGSNRYRKGLCLSLEKLAAEAEVPFSWAQWAYKVCGIQCTDSSGN